MVTRSSTTPSEIEESRGRGFPYLWPVADDYAIRDGVVISLMKGTPTPVTAHDFSGARIYLPLARPELPAEFAKVATGDDAAVLRFVRRYGLLSAYDLIPHARGDHVTWIVSHARAVQLISELALALAGKKDLARLLEGLTVRDATTSLEQVIVRCPQPREARPREFRPLDLRDSREVALRIIEQLLNANLDGVSRQLRVERGRLVSSFAPRRLLDYVYWLLADAIVAATLRTCEACGRFFVVTHDRMRFCPRPMGQRGVSLCMNRFKQQRFRDAKEKRRAQSSRKGMP